MGLAAPVGVGIAVGATVGVADGVCVGVGVAVASGSLVGDGVGVGVVQGSGSVPGAKYSRYAAVVAWGVFSSPLYGHINSSTMFLGLWNCSVGSPCKNLFISKRQIGAAPIEPAILSIGVLSLLPTQTPIVKLGV